MVSRAGCRLGEGLFHGRAGRGFATPGSTTAQGCLTLKWFRFNKGMITGLCKKGNMLFASGKAVRYGAELQIVHPKVTVVGQDEDAASLGSVVPVYPEVEGVKPGVLEKIMREAIEAVKEDITSAIPESLSASYNLPDLKNAFMTSHFPDSAAPGDPFKEDGAARIVLEEFFLFQIALLLKKKEEKADRGIGLRPGGYYRHLLKNLPFELTPGQERVRGEIERDMKSSEPMNRLLQGDVGCGKTVCAALAAAIALDNGCQAVFMAPTEILAEQHYLSIHRMLEGIGIEPVLVRGNMGGGKGRGPREDRERRSQGRRRHPRASPARRVLLSSRSCGDRRAAPVWRDPAEPAQGQRRRPRTSSS